MTPTTDPRRPRVYASGGHVRLTCHRGHYLAAIARRDWAGSNVEAMAGLPVRCADCAGTTGRKDT
jgi:hypothetical protein